MSPLELEQRLDLRALTDSLNVGVFAVEDGVLIYANQALASLLGKSPEELEGWSATRLVAPTARASLAKLLGRAASQPGPSEAELRLTTPTGEPLDVTLSLNRLPGSETLVGSVRDLSEQRKMERRLIEGEKLRVFGELASGIAHDFNNLLGAIMGRAQSLRRKVTGNVLGRDLELIETLAGEGAETIRRLQQVAKSNTVTGTSNIDLPTLASECLELTRPRWFDRCLSQGITISVQTAYEDVKPVSGNTSEIREIIINLLLNAVDAMPSGGTLSVRCWQQEEEVCLEIHDTGLGISEEDRLHVFEPFFTTKGAKGNGLGLAVAATIVERHRGRIDVDSGPGRGTAFMLVLPVSRDAASDTTAPESAPRPAAGTRVLLVEDEPHIRETMEEMLQAMGLEVVTAEDGNVAMERLKDGPYDVVLTDLGLPGANGYEVAAAARKQGAARHVILTTGWGASLEPDDWRRFGIDALLSKPFRIDDVLRLLAELDVKKGPRDQGRGAKLRG